MRSKTSAKTEFFKQLKHTSPKSILSYETAILQKNLFHWEFYLNSATGVQQAGPLGPALFALAIQSYIQGWIRPKCSVP